MASEGNAKGDETKAPQDTFNVHIDDKIYIVDAYDVAEASEAAKKLHDAATKTKDEKDRGNK